MSARFRLIMYDLYGNVTKDEPYTMLYGDTLNVCVNVIDDETGVSKQVVVATITDVTDGPNDPTLDVFRKFFSTLPESDDDSS